MIRFGVVCLCCVVLLMTACRSNHEDQGLKFNVQSYRSPVDYDIVLAGNFGEPRPWHFHGGLDIKTNNQEGKQIFSIADGYVSRLTVNKYGFGNAIYVSHPDGLTSVYCHLKRFADTYERLFERHGWRDTLDFRFPEGKLPVRAGDMIAISGNTGHSTGPHLHLELHDGKLAIASVWHGVEFLGQWVKPHRIYASRRSVGRIGHKLDQLEADCRSATAAAGSGVPIRCNGRLEATLNSYCGLLSHWQNYNNRAALLASRDTFAAHGLFDLSLRHWRGLAK